MATKVTKKRAPRLQSKVITTALNQGFKGLQLQVTAEFEVLNERINSTNAILERVEEQTKKTNGRVNNHEDEINDLKTADATHILNCPNVKEIQKINDDLNEYRLFKKYPKIAIGILALSCIIFIGGTYVIFNNFTKATKTEIKTELKNELAKDSIK